jgi:hypothetical protein
MYLFKQFKSMTVFIVVKKGEVANEVFTSLKMACERFGLSYSSSSKGKRVFVNENDEITSITEATVVKIKGRDNNAKKIKSDI